MFLSGVSCYRFVASGVLLIGAFALCLLSNRRYDKVKCFMFLVETLYNFRNTIGNLMIGLLFVGGCVFLLTGSWDASETEAATGCCGGGEATLGAETTGGCCGGTNKVSNFYSCSCLDNDDQTEASCDCDAEDNCNNSTGSYSCGNGCNDSRCGTGTENPCHQKGDTYCNNNVPSDSVTCDGADSKGNCNNG